ncbi:MULTISPECIES: hypothetical protein [unclassified Streptomyces]|uniref:hypothetical protein n=1 Tax=unclassified Streptomyces TaxID=2593676 RepID=UPI002E338959|nr:MULTISPECIES: hypothetical protein [unclassified Streptomyces]
MAPQPQGAPRWDARTQRWVWDAPAGAPAGTPAPGPASAPAATPQAPPAYDPLAPTAPQAYDGSRPPVHEGGLPSVPPPYDPHLLPGPPPPPPVPPGPPRPGGPGGRWLTPTTAGIAVAALAIGAAAVWFVERGSGQPSPHAGASASSAPADGGASGSRSPLGSSSGSPSGSPSASSGPSADAAHETVRDPKGFTLAVPTGWLREEAESGVFYRSPDRTSLLQVFRVSEADLSPLGAVQGASTDLRARTSGYEEIRVGQVPGSADAAELVYEYDSVESHGRRRGVERVSRTQDGAKWAVLTAGPAADWTVTLRHHTAALEAFRPGG